MAKSKSDEKRLNLVFFEGVNSLVASNLAKKNELRYMENAHCKMIGTIEKRKGFRRLGSTLPTATANHGLFDFQNTTGSFTSMFRISTVGGSIKIYNLNTAGNWGDIAVAALSAAQFDNTIAEGNCFLVNGIDANRYLTSAGNISITSASATGHLYNSPIASRVNYYKDRLYLGDYTVGSTRYKTGIMFSSNPLGIVALVDGDHSQPITSLKVTDTKYIQASDSLDIYRGGIKIGDITVTAKTEDTLTISSFGTNLNSADEIWIDDSYTGTRKFRWADNPASGIDVKQYDTFKLSEDPHNGITMMENVGDVMMISNNSGLAAWNGNSLIEFNLSIGCISKNGYIKTLGVLFFIHYTGIYSTTGGTPQLMSAKVEEYFEGATRAGLEVAAAGKKGKSIFFAIGNVILYNPDDSIRKTLTDVVLEYDLRKENWYVHTGIPAAQFATYIANDDADRLEFIADTGNYHVYEFLKERDDDDGEIPFSITTNDITLATNFEQFCYPKYLIVEAEAGNSIKSFISLDGDEFYELEGSINKGCTKIKITSKFKYPSMSVNQTLVRCRRIAISLKEFSKGLCKISRVALIYSETAEDQEQAN